MPCLSAAAHHFNAARLAVAALKDHFVSMVPENLEVFSFDSRSESTSFFAAALNRCLWQVLVMVTAVAMPLCRTRLGK